MATFTRSDDPQGALFVDTNLRGARLAGAAGSRCCPVPGSAGWIGYANVGPVGRLGLGAR